MKKILLGCMLCMIYTTSIFTTSSESPLFPNIHELLRYSALLPEKPAPDGVDWHHVTYKKFFYERSHPSTWTIIKSYLTMKSSELKISETIGTELNKQLQRLIQERQKRERIGNYVRIIRPETDAQFIIITNLNGAFHSLVHFLDYCIQKGLMDATFHIKKPYFLIFNGNILTDSPYGLDTLALMLQLKETTLDRVFFVRGNHEERGHWQTTNLSLEIEERSSTPKETTTLVGNLFDTMAEALYMVENVTETSADLVRISNFAFFSHSFDESNYSDLFADNRRQIICLNEPSRKHSSVKVHLKVIIRGSANPTEADKGLVIEEKKDETLIWQAQSGTTGTLQVLNRFFNESFIILNTTPQLTDWSLVLHSHDVRKPGSLEAIARYNLLTGNPMLDPVVQENKIRAYEEKKKTLAEQLHVVKTQEQAIDKALEQAKQQK